MARADLTLTITDDSGNAYKNKAVTLYETDSTTLLTQSVYAAASGGSPITSPSTNSLGLLEIYAASGQRAKMSVAGDTSGLKDVAFMPDPAAMLVQDPGVLVSLDAGATITRSSGGSATSPVLTLRDTNAAGYGLRVRNSGDTANLLAVSATNMALTVPQSVVATSTAYALGLQNAHADAKIMEIKDPTGTVVGRWNYLGLQLLQPNHRMSRLSVGEGFSDNSHDDIYAAKFVRNVLSSENGGTAVEVYADYANSGKDDSAFSIQARQLTTGSTRVTPLDLAAIRRVGDGTAYTIALEVGLHSIIDPDSTGDKHIGIWLWQGPEVWVQSGVPFYPQDTGLKISGSSGWDNFVRFHDRSAVAGGTGQTAFRVAGGFLSGDRLGDAVSVGDIYSYADANISGSGNGGTRVGILKHTNAPSGSTYGGMHYDNTQNALVIGARTGTGTYRSILLAPSAPAVAIGIATTSSINANTLLHVNGRIAAAATGSGPATPSYHFVGDLNTGMYSDNADTLEFATGGVEALRINSSSILDFRYPTNQAVAVGAGTVAAMGAIGGSGPTTQAMAGWVKFAINGTTSYFGYWR